MSGRLARAEELALQRQRLRARSAQLRAALARDAQVLVTPLALAEQARSGWRWLRHHPAWPVGGLLVLALVVRVRPRRMLGLATRAWGAWQLWQRARRLLGRALHPRRG